MWTTLDGYRLRLPRSGSTLITAQSPGTGRRASLCRPGGGLDRNAVHFVGRVVAASRRIGALRQTGTHRCFPVFTAEVNGRHYQLIAGPSVTPGELVLLAIRPEVRRFSGELSDGIGHRRAHNRLYNWLSRQGLPDAKTLAKTDPAAAARGEGIRDNMRQMIGLSGPTMPNQPDTSYPGYIGSGDLRRVNVEIDTTREGRQAHVDTVIAQDRGSMHIFQLVDEITGRPLEQWVWDPRLQRLLTNVPLNWRRPRPGVIQGAVQGTRGTQQPLDLRPPARPAPPEAPRDAQPSLPFQQQPGLPFGPRSREYELEAFL